MSYSTLTTESRGHIFAIGLNRPDKRNAFNLVMLSELARAYTEFEEDESLRCAVLFGHGAHFTAGLDLAEVGPAVASGTELFPQTAVDPLDLFGRRRSKPVVAAVRGWCLTIGIELLLACDVRVAADDTRFRQMEVSRGIMPFGGATLRFARAAGWGMAMRYLLTGDEFDAETARAMRLVEEVVPAGRELEAALALAERVASAAPLAVRATRESALSAEEGGDQRAKEQLMARARALMETDDAREGVQSFVERRQAVFTGR